MKYRVCPDCGLNIDFGEICDCRKENERETPATMSHARQEKDAGTYAACLQKNIPPIFGNFKR